MVWPLPSLTQWIWPAHRAEEEEKDGGMDGREGGRQSVGQFMFEPEPAETTNTAISIYFLLPYLRENKTEVKLQVGK